MFSHAIYSQRTDPLQPRTKAHESQHIRALPLPVQDSQAGLPSTSQTRCFAFRSLCSEDLPFPWLQPVWSQAHGQFLQGSFPWPGGTDWSRNSRGLGSGEVWYRQPRGRGCHQESCETLTSSVSCRLPTTSTKAEGQAGSTRPGSQSASPVMVPEVSAAAQQVGGDACTWLRAQSPGHQGKVRTGPPSPGPPEGWVTRQTTQQLW